MRVLDLKSGLSTAALLAAIGGPVMTHAAEAGAQPAAEPAVSEVVVTAMKREQTVLKIPAAVSAVPSQVLQQRGITTVDQLQFAVPGLQSSQGLNDEGGTANIVIRGVGLGPTGSQGVAEYVDGVYQPTAALGDLAQVDVARVEVLRGPQGTLYGRNANAGAINFISNAPTGEFGGYVQATIQNYNEQKVQAVLNAPLGDRVRTRFVFDYDERHDGFIKNLIPGGQDLDLGRNLAGRARIDVDLTSTLKFGLNVAAAKSDGAFSYAVEKYTNPLAVADNPIVGQIIVPSRPWTTTANDPVSDHRSFEMVAGTLVWSTPIGELKSITAYQHLNNRTIADLDTSDIHFFPSDFRSKRNTFTEEVNLSSKLGPVDTIIGAFVMDDNSNQLQIFHEPLGYAGLIPPGGSYIAHQPKYQTIAVAGFADATWNITDHLRVLGGLRYSDESQHVNYNTQVDLTGGTFYDLCPTTPAFPATGTLPLETANLHFGAVTGRGGVQYDVAHGQNVYATISQGYKSGGVNTAICGGDGQTFKPETITSYEIGYKARFFDGHVSLAADAFYYDYANFQLIQSGVGLVSLITNASAATVKGLEFEGSWDIDRHWQFTGNAAYLDARYSRYLTNDDFNPAGIGLPASACVTGSTVGNCIQDFSGHYLSYAPKFSANVGLAYRTDKYSWGGLTGRVDVSYRSRTYFRPSNELIDTQDPYAVANLALIWTSPSDRYSLRLFANNVSNVAYIAYTGSNGTIRALSYNWGTPRQYGAELKVKF